MMKEDNKREFDSETLILPAIKMVLTETDEHHRMASKGSKRKRSNRPTQKTVLKIIEALNKAD